MYFSLNYTSEWIWSIAHLIQLNIMWHVKKWNYNFIVSHFDVQFQIDLRYKSRQDSNYGYSVVVVGFYISTVSDNM